MPAIAQAGAASSSEISVDTLSVDRLRLLYDVSRELTTERDVKVLLDRTLDNLLAVYPAERGYLLRSKMRLQEALWLMLPVTTIWKQMMQKN